MFAQIPPALARQVVKDRLQEEERWRAARRIGETRRPVRPAEEA
jgi:hypothetical protein